MVWKKIEGYKFDYRISDQGNVQRFFQDKGWVELKTKVSLNRLHVTLRRTDGTQTKIAVVNLMDKCFFGGYARKNGLKITHKNGIKTDCAAENLHFTTPEEIGRLWGIVGSRKTVIRYDRHGNATAYSSVKEAARKNNLTTSSMNRRLNHGVLDPRGYRFVFDKSPTGPRAK